MQISGERKLITFLGKCGKYEFTNYCFEDDTCFESELTMDALVKKYNPEKIFVISTYAGFSSCRDMLNEKKLQYEMVCISTPRSNEDIWDLHTKIDEILEEKDKVILDITHSFRHIPLVSLISLLYEMRLKGIEIIGVFYGAYEFKSDDKTPVFDITSALDVIRWHYGLDNFERFGNASELVDLINDLQMEFKNKSGKEDMLKKIGDFKKIVGNIASISSAIYLNQNMDVLHYCNALSQNLSKYKNTIEELSKIYPPLKDIKLRVKRFIDMGYENPWNATINRNILRKLMLVAEYQRDIGLIGHSVETIREWFVSYLIFICVDNADDWLKREVRSDVEKALGKFLNEFKGNSGDFKETDPYRCMKEKLNKEEIKYMVEIWDKIVNIRNKVAHAGMTPSRIKNKKNIEIVNEIINKLQQIVKGDDV